MGVYNLMDIVSIQYSWIGFGFLMFLELIAAGVLANTIILMRTGKESKD